MKSSDKKDMRQAIVNRFIEQIQGEDSFLVNGGEARSLKVPINAETGQPYTSINRLLLTTPGENDPRWLTKNQAEFLGYFPKEGAEPRNILVWATTKRELLLGSDKQPFFDSAGRPKTKIVKLERPEMQFHEVFHAKDLVDINENGMLPYQGPLENDDSVAKAKNLLAVSGVEIQREKIRTTGVYKASENKIIMSDLDTWPNSEQADHANMVNGLCGHSMHKLGQAPDDPLWYGNAKFAEAHLKIALAQVFATQDLGLPSRPFSDGPVNAYVLDSWAKELEKDPNMLFRACTGAEKIKDHLLGLEMEVTQEKASQEPVRLSVPFTQRNEAKELGAYFHQEEKLWVSSPNNKNLTELTSRWPYDPEKHKPREQHEQKAPKRAYLDVPFEEKDQAKSLGAKFDFKKKQWYVEPDKDLSPFVEWLSEQDRKTLPVLSPEEEFAVVLKKAGLVLDGPPIMDGKPHKVPAAGQKKGAPQATYCFMPNPDQPSFYMNHHANESKSWTYSGQMLSVAKKTELETELSEKKQVLNQERTSAETKAINTIMDKIQHAPDAIEDHPYLKEREINSYGLRVDDNNNLFGIAVSIEKSLKDKAFSPSPQALINITPEGQASIEPKNKAAGAAILVGYSKFSDIGKNPTGDHVVLVAEDYESGAALYQTTKKPVAVAFGIQNMQTVAKALRKQLPEARITICVNHDKTPQKQTSLEKANKIAESVGGTITVMQPPLTKEQLASGLSSFGDMVRSGFDKTKLDLDKPKEADKKTGLGR